MGAAPYLAVLRRRWRVAACVTLLIIAATVGLVSTQQTKYQSTAQLFIAVTNTGDDASGLQSSDQFSQDRVKSYADLVSSPLVTGPVALELGGGLTGKQVAKEISADAPIGTVLVNVRATDPSPQRAQQLAEAVSTQFALFATRLETTSRSGAPPVKVTVAKPAQLPTTPSSPKWRLDIFLALLVGLLCGSVCAVLRDRSDRSIKTPDAARRISRSPILGAITYDPDARRLPVVLAAGHHSRRAEEFRRLRTNLQFVNVDKPPRSIVVTSCVPDEGKTTTAINLALTLAQSGLRIVLVEADLRRPKVSEYLGLDGSVGLTTALVGRAAIADLTQAWGDDTKLDIICSGPIPPNPSELLGSRALVDIVSHLSAMYDVVIVDAPPLLPVTDAAVISTATDGVVVVARYGKTREGQLTAAVESLAAVDAQILGVILTMTPKKGPDSNTYGHGYPQLPPLQIARAGRAGRRRRRRDVRAAAALPNGQFR